VLLLQPVPLHSHPRDRRAGAPVVAAFLWIGGQTTVLFLLQRFIVTYPWLTAAVDSARWLLWLGVLTALLAGALSATQSSLGRHFGYAGLFDYGSCWWRWRCAVRPSPTAIWLVLTRAIALLTMAAARRLSGITWKATGWIASARDLSTADGRPRADRGRFRADRPAIDRAVCLALGALPVARRDRSALGAALADRRDGVVIGMVRAGRACFGRSPVRPSNANRGAQFGCLHPRRLAS